MTSRRFVPAWVVAVGLLWMAWGCSSSPANTGGRGEAQMEVLSAVVRAAAADSKDRSGNERLIIANRTIPPTEGALPGLTAQQTAAMREANAEPLTLENWDPPHPSMLVNAGTIDKLLEGPPSEAWESFYGIFPEAGGVLRLSRPAYASAGREAFVYYELSWASLGAEGRVAFLEKAAGGEWRVKDERVIWMS